MITTTSILEELLKSIPELRSQTYFKSSLTALSHAMEDQVLSGQGQQPLVIANFQRERFYRQEANRYLRISNLTDHVYVLAAAETDFANRSDRYETIAFDETDELSHEWHLVVIGEQYSTCLVCRERYNAEEFDSDDGLALDQTRRFEGVWTFDRTVSCRAAELLLDRVVHYRPELKEKVAEARSLLTGAPILRDIDPDPFAQRLVTYLQAGQYKLQKAYRSISAQERQERLENLITTAIRQSLDPHEIFKVAVRELGQAMQVCRCLIYRCKATDSAVTIQHEYRDPCLDALTGESWPLANNPLFLKLAEQLEPVAIADTGVSSPELTTLRSLVQQWQIRSWLMVPVVYQGRLIGVIELHSCLSDPHRWEAEDIGLVNAIAVQIGTALIQAESYANLEDLNEQLEALERTRSNLIAITGHELRTPLSTIQVCLESLASEPDMPAELRQVMLSSALSDAERLRTLVQDFLKLSKLESGRVEWHLEPLDLEECVDLALSGLRTHQGSPLPKITAEVPLDLPLVQADGEWLVELLSKLLDNACKFTEPEGNVVIEARPSNESDTMLEVTIRDTGRGIEPNRLEAVFERFYQEEGALRRTAGGTGLGLAICRQIVVGLGGEIWAESQGRDQGTQFHFTIPTVEQIRRSVARPAIAPTPSSTRSPKKSTTIK
jgi:DICT domain-containing protein/nitrogen-specific signal transduction histidine kinase